MISVQEILGRLDAVKKTGPGQWMGRCPAHEDRIPSLSVKDGEKILLKCFADCEFSDIVQALGLKESDLFPDNGTNGKGSKPEIIAAYEYRNEDDEPVGRVVRLPGKNFRQQHRCPEAPDGWTWGLGGDPKRCECPKVQLPLYRLSRVIEGVALGKTIHVVEGEKDVQAIEKAGGVATCNPGGAGNWRDEYSENLRGARVVVVADNDEKGKEHAQAVAMSLEGIAASVKIVLAREGKDAADHIAAGHGLDDFVPLDQEERKLPAPMGINDLMQVAEPEEHWLVEGHVPAGGNVLVAGYPKTFKTFFLLELSVALASQTPFLGKFDVPERRRVGLVLMEDQAHRVRRRLNRLCEGRRIDLSELDGWLHFWFRPPLRLNDQTVRELGDYAAELELDFLGIDSWSYVASGDSNSADEVTPQLQDLSLARTKREGLTVELTHHARKEREDKKTGTRLTDEIRNSGAFGAWYDAALVLSRPDATSPVTVRIGLRDFPTPDSFAFTVEDQDPARPENNYRSGGWLRRQVSDHRPELLRRMAAAEKFVPAVREHLREHSGCSKRALRLAVNGKASDIDAAVKLLEKSGEVRVEPSEGPGKPSRIHLQEDSK